jgi:hypothetical protein
MTIGLGLFCGRRDAGVNNGFIVIHARDPVAKPSSTTPQAQRFVLHSSVFDSVPRFGGSAETVGFGPGFDDVRAVGEAVENRFA